MSGGFFKGTSLDQDSRFGDPQKKLLNKIKFPPSFKEKVDVKKVNMAVMKPWITKKLFDTLGFDDEVVVEYVFSMLEEEPIDPRRMQINLTGFLEQKAPSFMEELWDSLLGAQKGVDGIPLEFIEAKKQELLQKQLENEKIMLQIREQRQKITKEAHRSRDISPDKDSHRESTSNRSRKHDAPKDDRDKKSNRKDNGYEREKHRSSRRSRYDYDDRDRKSNYSRRRNDGSKDRSYHRSSRRDISRSRSSSIPRNRDGHSRRSTREYRSERGDTRSTRNRKGSRDRSRHIDSYKPSERERDRDRNSREDKRDSRLQAKDKIELPNADIDIDAIIANEKKY